MWGVRPAAPEERSLDLHRSGENSTEGFCKAQMYFPRCQSQARQPSPSLGVISSEVGPSAPVKDATWGLCWEGIYNSLP